MIEIFGGPDRDRTDNLFHAKEEVVTPTKVTLIPPVIIFIKDSMVFQFVQSHMI